jgi:hypothetical protein
VREAHAMPYQVHLRRKNRKAVEAIMGVRLGSPKVGDVIECPVRIKAKIIEIEPTKVGAEIDQSLIIIKADEI